MKIEHNELRDSYIIDDAIEVFVNDFERADFTVKTLDGSTVTKAHEKVFWDWYDLVRSVAEADPR